MYCHSCIKKFALDAVYCSQCGKLLHSQRENEAGEVADWPSAHQEIAVSIEKGQVGNEIEIQMPAPPKVQSDRSIWDWLMPTALVALAVVTAVTVLGYYQYESNLNDHVVKLQQEAKVAALAGQYEEALELLAEASSARPQYTALRADEEIVEHAAEVDRMLVQVEQQLTTSSVSELEKGLERARAELSGHKEPIFAKLRGKLDELNKQLTVTKLTTQIEGMSTIKELSETLNIVNGIIGNEAASLSRMIIAKIKEISISNAEELLNKKNFTAALVTIDQALALAKGDEQLQALQERIRSKQTQYEQAEQQRIEQAMQRAAEEDLINQTAAVEVIGIEQTLDEFGDLNIAGQLKNAATRPIYSVAVEFTVYNSEGEAVGKGTAIATPNYIEIGEEMSFTSTVYGVYEDDTTVVIDHATWYLD